MENARLGFIGLGNMGSRLAANLMVDFGNLTVWDRTPENSTAHCPKGANQADSITELANNADIIFVAVSNDEADKAVIEQLLATDIKDKTIIDFSTVSPSSSVELASRVKAAGSQFLDAGLSGSTPQVENRELVIVVGGEKTTFDTCRHYLDKLGKAVFYMGPNGYGLIMKLCINILLGVGAQALAEALTLGQKSGLDKTAMIEVLNTTAVVSPSQKSKLELAQNDSYTPVTFSLELIHKDLGLMMSQAQKVNAPLPATAAAQQIAATGTATNTVADFAVIIQLMEKLANVSSQNN